MPVSKYYKGRGKKVMKDMQKRYGKKKGKEVFYATANKRDMNPEDDKEARDLELMSIAPEHFLRGYITKSAANAGAALLGAAGTTVGGSALFGALLGAVMARRKRRLSGAMHGAGIGASAGLGALGGAGLGAAAGGIGGAALGSQLPTEKKFSLGTGKGKMELGIPVSEGDRAAAMAGLGLAGAGLGGVVGTGAGALTAGALAAKLSAMVRARSKDPFEPLTEEERARQREEENV